MSRRSGRTRTTLSAVSASPVNATVTKISVLAPVTHTVSEDLYGMAIGAINTAVICRDLEDDVWNADVRCAKESIIQYPWEREPDPATNFDSGGL